MLAVPSSIQALTKMLVCPRSTSSFTRSNSVIEAMAVVEPPGWVLWANVCAVPGNQTCCAGAPSTTLGSKLSTRALQYGRGLKYFMRLYLETHSSSPWKTQRIPGISKGPRPRGLMKRSHEKGLDDSVPSNRTFSCFPELPSSVCITVNSKPFPTRFLDSDLPTCSPPSLTVMVCRCTASTKRTCSQGGHSPIPAPSEEYGARATIAQSVSTHTDPGGGAFPLTTQKSMSHDPHASVTPSSPDSGFNSLGGGPMSRIIVSMRLDSATAPTRQHLLFVRTEIAQSPLFTVHDCMLFRRAMAVASCTCQCFTSPTLT
mmetsp:Transcript_28311/g.79162  ORF Transcript_28311/g.79162 Transcript_28311/m.79162 type:complete len:315 (+) Transcript_28311:431-1375(+)